MKFWKNAHKSSLLCVCVGRWEIGSEGGARQEHAFIKYLYMLNSECTLLILNK